MEYKFIFSKLPFVLIHKCINYTGKVTFRNGKYIDRIDTNDERYRMVQKITRPIKLLQNKYVIYLLKRIEVNDGICLHYTFNNDTNGTILEIMGNKQNTYGKHCLDANGIWRRLMNYTM
jgi:hypothetical protein